ncbi:MAG: hypothetical protein RLZZ426_1257 [Actinomycetota bacterium]
MRIELTVYVSREPSVKTSRESEDHISYGHITDRQKLVAPHRTIVLTQHTSKLSRDIGKTLV